MSAWWIAALVPGWLACSVLLALAIGRAVRIRDRHRIEALANATRED